MIHAARYIHILLLAAFVLAGVSPACEFISGKGSFIEICAADGSLQRVAVDQNQTPLDNETPSKNHQAKPDCAFCFAQSHFKPLSQTPATALYTPVPQSRIMENNTAGVASLSRTAFEARGPPAFVLS